jgi:hypothetical protein
MMARISRPRMGVNLYPCPESPDAIKTLEKEGW